MTNITAVDSSLNEFTKLIWIESPTNPLLKIIDIGAISKAAKLRNISVCVDNTFLSPYLQNPLLLGADLVIHSVTKYISGHSDCVMGAVVTNNEEWYTKLRFIQNGVGAVPSPFDCYMAQRGLKTLHLRMEAAMRNAHKIANYLESHKMIERVIYPGLQSHPQHKLCKLQATGFGAMITFYMHGNKLIVSKFLSSLRIFTLAESLGAVESLIEAPCK
jgi:cystathionine gamma-lyase